MKKSQLLSVVCAGALGLGSAAAVSACGEDRGGVQIEGGGTTATTPTTTTP